MKLLPFLVAGAALWLGCDFAAPAKDQVFSIDKTVDQGTADRIGTLLLGRVPAIRAEREQLQQKSGKPLQMIIRVENAPEPGYQGPDAAYHHSYYWMYVGYHGKDGIVKYYRYLVHKDLTEILFYDDAKDAFVKPAQGLP